MKKDILLHVKTNVRAGFPEGYDDCLKANQQLKSAVRKEYCKPCIDAERGYPKCVY